MKKAVFNWSGGKDSSLTLYRIRKNQEYDIEMLLTSVNSEFNRISMHGVRCELLEQQAECMGLPLHKLNVPGVVSMEEYDKILEEALAKIKEQQIEYSIFGDIFLEDLRKYREGQLAKYNMKGVFPIWKEDTTKLAKEFVEVGFKSVVVCINEANLDKTFVGREMDKDFFKDLPNNVDPCGENGEFHSFVYDGPIFKEPIQFDLGEKVYKKYERDKKKESADCPWQDTGFWYCDLIPTKTHEKV